jgi:hypothetical protein
MVACRTAVNGLKIRPETKFYEKWKQDHEWLVYNMEGVKMPCKDCADFHGKKIKTKKVLQPQVFL